MNFSNNSHVIKNWNSYWDFEGHRLDYWVSNWETSFEAQKALYLFQTLSNQGININAKLLDVSCGIGIKTIILKSKGMDVTGSDASKASIKIAKKLSERIGYRIGFFEANWEKISVQAMPIYNILYNDALSWIGNERNLLLCSKQFYNLLPNSGMLFFYSNNTLSIDELNNIRLSMWENRLDGNLSWDFENDKYLVNCFDYAYLGDDYIDILYLFKKRNLNNGNLDFRLATIRELYRWTDPQLFNILKMAGFREFQSFGKLHCAYK